MLLGRVKLKPPKSSSSSLSPKISAISLSEKSSSSELSIQCKRDFRNGAYSMLKLWKSLQRVSSKTHYECFAIEAHGLKGYAFLFNLQYFRPPSSKLMPRFFITMHQRSNSQKSGLVRPRRKKNIPVFWWSPVKGLIGGNLSITIECAHLFWEVRYVLSKYSWHLLTLEVFTNYNWSGECKTMLSDNFVSFFRQNCLNFCMWFSIK